VFSAVRAFGAELGGLEVINVILSALVGLALIYAGTQVMARQEQGRILGLGLSAVGAIFALLALIQGFTPAIVSLLLNAFVIYALTQTGESFRR
jgi:TRAP-type C4-dicarboxylate transport system permease small subunit